MERMIDAHRFGHHEKCDAAGQEHAGEYAYLERMVRATRRLDPTRPVVDNDGWEHTDITDVCAIHDYTPTAAQLRERYSELHNLTVAFVGDGCNLAQSWIEAAAMMHFELRVACRAGY